MKCRRHERPNCSQSDCRFDRIDETLLTIINQLDRIEQKENIMSQELDALTQDVAAETAIDQSAITLINGIAAKLDAMKNDPAAITALSSQLKASSSALAAAVAANTPADAPLEGTPTA